jgi:NADH-quinone oxidoreductase subunit H
MFVLILVVGSLNLLVFCIYTRSLLVIIPFAPLCFVYIISAMLKLIDHLLNLPEAEGELVAGFYNVEYSAVGFALFFIAEYANLVFFFFKVL